MSIGKSFGDKAHHPNRRVDRDSFFNRTQSQMGGEVTHSQDTDEAPAQGIPRPDTSNIRHEDDAPPHGIPRPNLDEVLDPWDPEDVEEQYNLKEERLKKGHY